MTPTLLDTFMISLVAAYVLAGTLFVMNLRKGKTFVAAFDRAAAWGGGAFVAACCMEPVIYMAPN